MLLALYVAAAINVVVACAVSYRRREHLTLALLFLASLLSDLTKRIARTIYIDDVPPYAGLARAAFHVGEACVVTWPVGLAAASLVIFFKLSVRPVLIPARMLLWALVIGYPFPFRGHALGLVYAGVSGCAFVVGAAGAVVDQTVEGQGARVAGSQAALDQDHGDQTPLGGGPPIQVRRRLDLGHDVLGETSADPGRSRRTVPSSRCFRPRPSA